MQKRIIICLLVLCFLLILPGCGRAKDTAEEMYSVSKAFLNVHYGVSLNQAKEYAQVKAELENGSVRRPPVQGVYDIEDVNPDLAERLKALFRQKYQTQPLTDKGLELLIANTLPQTLWDVVLSTGSDIKITSEKVSLRNTEIGDKQNDINYTINLLIKETSYEVNGVLVLVLVDGKWQIDNVRESGWSPKLPY